MAAFAVQVETYHFWEDRNHTVLDDLSMSFIVLRACIPAKPDYPAGYSHFIASAEVA